MELSVKDRLYLPTFLPARGNFKEFNLKKEILRKIAIGDEERKAINLRENAEDKRIEWDVEKEHPLEVEFSADEMAYLQAACEKISDEELEHMGFIKFGSRVDLYLPLDCDIKVALHDKTIGDLTEIARLK